MELENLKYLWQEQETPAAREPSPEELHALLQKKSRGPIARMRRNLRKELIIILVTYIPCIIFYLVGFQSRLWSISVLFLVVGAFFCGYYLRKYRLLNQMQCVSCEVRSNLALQVSTLKRYTRFYLWASTAVIPLTAVFTFLAFRFQLFSQQGHQVYHQLSPSPWWKSSVFWFVLLVPFTIGIYYLNVWNINRLYGRHIKKLQELLHEMDEE